MVPATPTSYQANPDVSCREEAPGEGAILFNPDIDAVLVINPTSLLLWRALTQPCTIEDLKACLLASCDGVPVDEVSSDIEAFLKALLPGGFIGEVVKGGQAG